MTDTVIAAAAAITADQAVAIADAFEAHGIDSIYSVSFSLPKVPYVGSDGTPGNFNVYQRKYLEFADLIAMVADLPEGWDKAVNAVLSAREEEAAKARHAARIAARIAGFEKIENPAIRAYLIKTVEERGRDDAKPADLSHLAARAKQQTEFKAAYKPKPGCKAKLHLKEALVIGHRQEAYADNTDYIVPVTVEEGSDLAICRANLWDFANACRTANGLAGYGSTWSMELVETPEGCFVLVDQRSSIAD